MAVRGARCNPGQTFCVTSVHVDGSCVLVLEADNALINSYNYGVDAKACEGFHSNRVSQFNVPGTVVTVYCCTPQYSKTMRPSSLNPFYRNT